MNDQNPNKLKELLAEMIPDEIKESLDITKEAKEIAKNIFQPASEETGNMLADTFGLFGDKIKTYRIKKQIDYLFEINKKYSSLNLKPGPVPFKYLPILIENGSFEENNIIKEKWENLLINASQREKNNLFHPVYIKILENLSPMDATILDYIYSMVTPAPIWSKKDVSKSEIISNHDLDEELFEISTDNLLSLNLIRLARSTITTLDRISLLNLTR